METILALLDAISRDITRANVGLEKIDSDVVTMVERFVCKSWLSLISSPQFVKAHLLLSSTNKDYTHHRVLCEDYYSNPDVRGCSVNSLLCDSVTEALDLDYHRKIFGAHPRLVGYINGLI
ncbi:hypothetical protein P3S68_023189 [Capsicum galapagoense]